MAEKKKAPQRAESPNLDQLSNALWAACRKQPADDRYWFQEDLMGLKVIPNDDVLMLNECIIRLAERHLLKHFSKEGRACWEVFSRDDALKFHNLTTEEEIVFANIQSCGREGIWYKTIRTRSNLHEAVCKRCLKSLEQKKLIKSFHNARHSKSKFWILADLQPSESVTGGLFYTEGELDKEFVRVLGAWAEQFVHKKSWYRNASKSEAKKLGKGKLSREEAEKARAEGFQGEGKARSKWLPMPPGYTGYPTLSDVTRELNQANIAKEKLKEAEVSQILDLLCWDERIEKVLDGRAYRGVLPALTGGEDESRSALSEAPCGRCPVFDFCDESGPVNARTCTYFRDWLAL